MFAPCRNLPEHAPATPLENFTFVGEATVDVDLWGDLGSKTGVFVRVQGRHELQHGDELLLGRTRLRLDLKPLLTH